MHKSSPRAKQARALQDDLAELKLAYLELRSRVPANSPFIAGWGGWAHLCGMIRQIVIAGIGSVLLAGLPALAQELPELDGAPGPLKIPATQPKTPVERPPVEKAPVQKTQVAKPKAVAPVAPKAVTTVSVTKAEAARLEREAEALRVERARLDNQAADLKSRQAILDARAAEIASKEKGVASRESELAAEKAQLARDTEDVARQLAQATRTERPAAAIAPAATAPASRQVEPRDRQLGYASLDHETALDVCINASEDAARVQNFYSVRYDVEPRFYDGRYLQVRGLMRVEDRRGYRILDTLCEVDRAGDVQRFVFLR